MGNKRGYRRTEVLIALVIAMACLGTGVSSQVGAAGGAEGSGSESVAVAFDGTGAGSAAGSDAGSGSVATNGSDAGTMAGSSADVVVGFVTQFAATDYAWDETVAPEYVVQVGSANLSDVPDDVGMTYGGLDEYGRATWALLVADGPWYQRKHEQGRDDTDLPDPTGWPEDNEEVSVVTPDGNVYRGYFWNRSHLVADALGGDPIAENLVIGTRMQNVGANDGQGGMLYIETLVRDWLAAHPSADDRLVYRAEAIYQGAEPIPRAVLVDVRSSDGTIDGEWLVFNAAKGYAIDYATGAIVGAGR